MKPVSSEETPPSTLALSTYPGGVGVVGRTFTPSEIVHEPSPRIIVITRETYKVSVSVGDLTLGGTPSLPTTNVTDPVHLFLVRVINMLMEKVDRAYWSPSKCVCASDRVISVSCESGVRETDKDFTQ